LISNDSQSVCLCLSLPLCIALLSFPPIQRRHWQGQTHGDGGRQGGREIGRQREEDVRRGGDMETGRPMDETDAQVKEVG